MLVQKRLGHLAVVMDGAALMPDHVLDPPPPPPRLFERLRQIAGYTWDESKPPFHSSYDFWYVTLPPACSSSILERLILSDPRHVFGTRHVSPNSPPESPRLNESISGSVRRPSPSDHGHAVPSDTQSADTLRTPQKTPTPTLPVPPTDASSVEEPVVARVSFHPIREERAFQIAKSVIATADPHGDHIVKPLDIVRLSPTPGDRAAVIVSIYAHPGYNFLLDYIDMGPAFYMAKKEGDAYVSYRRKPSGTVQPPLKLEYFLDFAIGAAQCLEILHHGQGIVHGEIRGDAFHFNADENKVRIISFGSGTRSFEHGLTSTG